ncbi:LacI family DNA-binding transcriptional regulator [Microbacterium sp. NPDC087591]|uniref:LacI family DNA-binding transcriptional regulator n=1 Tax=Microbacterium sp. NPDC087591 TaxID=3364192 RepID=UPI003802FE30
MLPRHSAVTLEQVARQAGVSRATVSRIVNGVSTVDPALAERVNVVVKQLGYVPNLSARSLASRRAGAVALVVPEDVERFFGDPFFGALVAGIQGKMRGSGFLLDVLIAADDPRQTSDLLLGGKVDAAILFSHRIEQSFMSMMSASLPVVLAGRPTDATEPTCHYVDVDNRGGAELVTRHLLERGHRRIAMIRGPEDSPAAVDRLQGYLDAHEAAGIEAGPIVAGDFTSAGGVAGAERLLDESASCTAVFAANDLMAIGAMGVLRKRGLRIPDDIAIAGFDDVPSAADTVPPLTTVRQPSREQGAALAATALALVAGEPVEQGQVLATELIVREST